MVTVCDFRDQLVLRLRGSADVRARKAADHTVDHRNKTSKIALEVAAREVAALPDDDPRLVHLATFSQRGAEIDAYLDDESRLIGRHGFGPRDTKTTPELLHALTAAAWRAAAWGRMERGPAADSDERD
jgi:hypothetical protein